MGGVSKRHGLIARCLGDRVELFDLRSRVFRRSLPGCSPAWRPDGGLTIADPSGIVLVPLGSGARRRLVARDGFERAARRHPNVPERGGRLRVLVDGVAWVSETRAAVLLSIRLGGRLAGIGAQHAVAFFEGGRLLVVRPFFRSDLAHLHRSPNGTYVTALPGIILRRDGTQVSLPTALQLARVLAWSPDERWLALALPRSVLLVETASLERFDDTGSGLRTIELPLQGRELEWR